LAVQEVANEEAENGEPKRKKTEKEEDVKERLPNESRGDPAGIR